MSKGIYNFSDPYGKGVKDEHPKWMDELFNKKIEKKEPTIINDLYKSNKYADSSNVVTLIGDSGVGKTNILY